VLGISDVVVASTTTSSILLPEPPAVTITDVVVGTCRFVSAEPSSADPLLTVEA
jgi:hypothetical protein